MSTIVSIGQSNNTNSVFNLGTNYKSEKQLNPFQNITPKDERNSILEKARNKAFSKVSQAWDADKEIDTSIQERKIDYKTRSEMNLEYADKMAFYENEMTSLRESYGINPESDEEKDLQILCRGIDDIFGIQSANFTKEEAERFNKLFISKRTDYQEAALAIHSSINTIKCEIRDNINAMKDDVYDVKAISNERLKSHAMLDAQKEAEEIIENENAEIMNNILGEVKDTVDEKAKETEKKIKENKEEKEAEDEKLQESKIKQLEKEAMLEQSVDSLNALENAERKRDNPDIEGAELINAASDFNSSTGIQNSLNNIKANMRLLEADLKGIKVNNEV